MVRCLELTETNRQPQPASAGCGHGRRQRDPLVKLALVAQIRQGEQAIEIACVPPKSSHGTPDHYTKPFKTSDLLVMRSGGVSAKSIEGTADRSDTPFTKARRTAGVVAGMAKVMENEKRAFSIAAFCENYGIGRTSAYEEIAAGRLRVVKAGKRTLVPADAAEAWLKNLPNSPKSQLP